MGKKSSPSPPAPPSAEETAKAAQLNIYDPSGAGIRYGSTDGSGNFIDRADQSGYRIIESPFQQRLRQLAESITGSYGQNLGNQQIPNMISSLDFSKIPNLPKYEDFSSMGQQAAADEFKRSMNLLQPGFEQENMRAEQSLANKGLPMGSAARDEELARISRTQNEAKNNAQLAANASGRDYQQQQFVNAMAARDASLNDQLRQIGLASDTRNQYLAELAALTGTPYASPYRQGATDSNMAAALQQGYQGAMNNYNQQMQSRNSMFGTLGGLAGTIGAAIISDENVKTNKSEIDKNQILDSVNSLKVESWNYIWGGDRHIGPYAQEWKQKIGLGDGRTISVVDAIGVLIASVQALSMKIDQLEGKTNGVV